MARPLALRYLPVISALLCAMLLVPCVAQARIICALPEDSDNVDPFERQKRIYDCDRTVVCANNPAEPMPSDIFSVLPSSRPAGGDSGSNDGDTIKRENGYFRLAVFFADMLPRDPSSGKFFIPRYGEDDPLAGAIKLPEVSKGAIPQEAVVAVTCTTPPRNSAGQPISDETFYIPVGEDGVTKKHFYASLQGWEQKLESTRIEALPGFDGKHCSMTVWQKHSAAARQGTIGYHSVTVELETKTAAYLGTDTAVYSAVRLPRAPLMYFPVSPEGLTSTSVKAEACQGQGATPTYSFPEGTKIVYADTKEIFPGPLAAISISSASESMGNFNAQLANSANVPPALQGMVGSRSGFMITAAAASINLIDPDTGRPLVVQAGPGNTEGMATLVGRLANGAPQNLPWLSTWSLDPFTGQWSFSGNASIGAGGGAQAATNLTGLVNFDWFKTNPPCATFFGHPDCGPISVKFTVTETSSGSSRDRTATIAPEGYQTLINIPEGTIDLEVTPPARCESGVFVGNNQESDTRFKTGGPADLPTGVPSAEEICGGVDDPAARGCETCAVFCPVKAEGGFDCEGPPQPCPDMDPRGAGRCPHPSLTQLMENLPEQCFDVDASTYLTYKDTVQDSRAGLSIDPGLRFTFAARSDGTANSIKVVDGGSQCTVSTLTATPSSAEREFESPVISSQRRQVLYVERPVLGSSAGGSAQLWLHDTAHDDRVLLGEGLYPEDNPEDLGHRHAISCYGNQAFWVLRDGSTSNDNLFGYLLRHQCGKPKTRVTLQMTQVPVLETRHRLGRVEVLDETPVLGTDGKETGVIITIAFSANFDHEKGNYILDDERREHYDFMVQRYLLEFGGENECFQGIKRLGVCRATFADDTPIRLDSFGTTNQLERPGGGRTVNAAIDGVLAHWAENGYESCPGPTR